MGYCSKRFELLYLCCGVNLARVLGSSDNDTLWEFLCGGSDIRATWHCWATSEALTSSWPWASRWLRSSWTGTSFSWPPAWARERAATWWSCRSRSWTRRTRWEETRSFRSRSRRFFSSASAANRQLSVKTSKNYKNLETSKFETYSSKHKFDENEVKKAQNSLF